MVITVNYHDLLMIYLHTGKVSSLQSELEELEGHMTQLSVRDGQMTNALEQLPPVPDHNTSSSEAKRAAEGKKQVLLATS